MCLSSINDPPQNCLPPFSRAIKKEIHEQHHCGEVWLYFCLFTRNPGPLRLISRPTVDDPQGMLSLNPLNGFHVVALLGVADGIVPSHSATSAGTSTGTHGLFGGLGRRLSGRLSGWLSWRLSGWLSWRLVRRLSRGSLSWRRGGRVFRPLRRILGRRSRWILRGITSRGVMVGRVSRQGGNSVVRGMRGQRRNAGVKAGRRLLGHMCWRLLGHMSWRLLLLRRLRMLRHIHRGSEALLDAEAGDRRGNRSLESRQYRRQSRHPCPESRTAGKCCNKRPCRWPRRSWRRRRGFRKPSPASRRAFGSTGSIGACSRKRRSCVKYL
jgi:hypothetical protein